MYFAGQESLQKTKTSQLNGYLRTFRMSRKSRVFSNRQWRSTTTFRYSVSYVYENNGVGGKRGKKRSSGTKMLVRRLFIVKNMGPITEYRIIKTNLEFLRTDYPISKNRSKIIDGQFVS